MTHTHQRDPQGARPSRRGYPRARALLSPLLAGLLVSAGLYLLVQERLSAGTADVASAPEAAEGHVAPAAAAPPAAADPPAVADPPASVPERMEFDPAEVHATSQLLVRAERSPTASIEALAAMRLPWARAWAGFLLVARHPEDPAAVARAIALLEDAHAAMRAAGVVEPTVSLTAEEALVAVRLLGEDVPDSREVPCWIARRWPEAWVGAFDALHGNSRDGYLPQCDPPLDGDWAIAHTDTAHRMLGPINGFCGTLSFAERRSAFVAPFRAWYLPRSRLPELNERRAMREETRTELLEALDGDVEARDRYLAAVQTSAAWRRRLVKHLRARGLSRGEADIVVEETEATIESCMISAELRCGREAF
jgi:hypothetical protein